MGMDTGIRQLLAMLLVKVIISEIYITLYIPGSIFSALHAFILLTAVTAL